jgi:hypothetical protein
MEDFTEFVCELQSAEFANHDEYGISRHLQRRRNEVYDERWHGFEPDPAVSGRMRRIKPESITAQAAVTTQTSAPSSGADSQ